MKSNSSDEIPGVPPGGETVLKGIAASPGIAVGEVLIVSDTDSRLAVFDIPERTVSGNEVQSELDRFRKAMDETRTDITALKDNLAESGCIENANIFDAHLILVGDEALMREVASGIEERHLAAECAFAAAVLHFVEIFKAIPDPYIRERASDITDVGSRIMSHLLNRETAVLESLPGQRIVAAGELVPSDTAKLDRENVLAFITQTGSRTSHTSILARSMKIPAVVGIPDLLGHLKPGVLIAVDGSKGEVILEPSAETLNRLAQEEALQRRLDTELIGESSLRPVALDGYRMELAANIDSTVPLADIRRYGAAGVGLFRTEYLFMNTDHLPSEEEQLAVFKSVIEASGGEPVTIRTLDLGGDKISRLINFKHEANPYLGMRSIRLCLRFPELLIPQLRAVLRAAVYGHVRLMFPMITTLDELEKMLQLLERVKSSLKYDNIPFSDHVETGMMMETPAAAMMADVFAKKCDFFSIGTNDLVQYTMAVDRGNENVAYLCQPWHPVIVRLIHRICEAAGKAGIWVSVCGEMAADPQYIPLLMGLGVQELSMSPRSLGNARRMIRALNYLDAEKAAHQALDCVSHEEIRTVFHNLTRNILPELNL